MEREYDYVILGAGNSAGYAAREFVNKGITPNSVAIIGEEAVAPYERPALSKGYLLGKAKLPGFHTCAAEGSTHDAEWYKTNNIDLFLSTQITQADVKTKTLTATNGDVFKAKKALVIATGCRPIVLSRSPGHDLDGICYLRNLSDGEKLLEKIGSAKSCVMIGGGYIGMECSAALISRGVAVTMVFPETHMMARLFTPALAEFYENEFKEKGVKFVKGLVSSEFVGENGRVTGCKLSNGEVIPGDIVCIGVGAIPNSSLFDNQLENAPRPPGGIKVDSMFETSEKGVYAIGDVCGFPLLKYNRIERTEHVTHARLSAKHVVNVLTGNPSEYNYLPHFYSRVFDRSWKFWGDAVGDVHIIGDFKPVLIALWVKDGKIMGSFMESGSDDDNNVIKSFANDQPSVDVSKLSSAKNLDDIKAALVV